MPPRKVSARTRRAAKALGERCVEWRKLQDLTAQQVAQRAGISNPTLWKLESGDPGVSLGVFLDVARASASPTSSRTQPIRSRPSWAGLARPRPSRSASATKSFRRTYGRRGHERALEPCPGL